MGLGRPRVHDSLNPDLRPAKPTTRPDPLQFQDWETSLHRTVGGAPSSGAFAVPGASSSVLAVSGSSLTGAASLVSAVNSPRLADSALGLHDPKNPGWDPAISR
jgi:hypothetical protein